MTTDGSSTVHLQTSWTCTAHRIVGRGTRSESVVLEALAAAAGTLCPAAARALVDWEAPEIVRVRAFGIVHGALLRELASLDRQAAPSVEQVELPRLAA